MRIPIILAIKTILNLFKTSKKMVEDMTKINITKSKTKFPHGVNMGVMLYT